MDLRELRKRYHNELFSVVLPFWDRHGIDHEHGGFFCTLGHDGSLIDSDKFLWFQGRGLWVYSFLYNHFGGDPKHLEVARRTKDFLLRPAVQSGGWWPELLSREGEVKRSFEGDLYGMYFAAEGLQEYAWAAGDEAAGRTAGELLSKLFRYTESGALALRAQGLWMMNLRIATQMLARRKDPEIEQIASLSVEAIMERHYNPETDLNDETLRLDFSRPREEAGKCVIGHSIECLWMVLDEALRRRDGALYERAAARLRRHLEAGWDEEEGGIADSIYVGRHDYRWPPIRPVGTPLEFHATGEYNYMKSLWALNEVLVATLNVIEHTGAAWAVDFFERAQETIDSRFSLRSRGYPLYLLFTDRVFSFQENQNRQDNYHLPRQLMLNLLALDRMIGRATATGGNG